MELMYATPKSWAPAVLQAPLLLLNDHAHLEKKAANNALELLSRWPHGNIPERWVRGLAGVARDETLHLKQVSSLLLQKGGQLSRNHRNSYAGHLHNLVRRGAGHAELIDRLLIAALIEARSCERFQLLLRHTDDESLRRLYGGLMAAERGHYKLFLELADLLQPETAQARWMELLVCEARIMAAEPFELRLLSGAPGN
ncbi:MAG: hypothetical protein KDK30_06925 [Leptospiraceae bacterium]|nr:hypothetical protein [Leptospiraceae bacterium]